MIENLMYLILSVQIYFLTNHVLNVAVSSPSFKKYLPFVAFGITAFFWLILFVMKLNKLISLILSFFFGFILSGINNAFNFLTFSALYLYITGKLREKRILKKNHLFLLSPILLLGFIPLRAKGVFEVFLQRKIHKLLYSAGSGSGTAHSGGSGTVFVNGGGNYFQKTVNVSQAMFHSSRSFEMFIVSAALLILLAVFLMFLAKFYLVSKNKKAFFTTFTVGIFVFTGVIVLASYLFFTLVKLYDAAISKIRNLQGMSGKFPGGFEGNLKVVEKVVRSGKFVSHINNVLQIAGFLLVVLGIILGVAFIYVLWNILFSDKKEDTLFGKKESKIFEKKIKRKGIEPSLSEIEDPNEYIKFLYFSCIYLFRKKGFPMEKFETPSEFLNRIFRTTDKPIPNFDKLTNLFNEVKYGVPKEFSLEKIKSDLQPELMIHELKNLPSKTNTVGGNVQKRVRDIR